MSHGWRRLPPVYSPVSLGGIVAGWTTALGLGGADAQERLIAALRSHFTADVVLLTDSGTSALAVAILSALRSRPGAPVALPAYSCYDLATAAAAADVPVLLYDVDPTTLGPDWPSFDRALANGAQAAVVAHLFGFAVDMERARAACAAVGAVLIEDAAQSAGGRLQGARLGACAGLSVLSFGRGKGMTGGGGGALLGRGQDGRLLANANLPAGTGAVRSLVGISAQWLLGRPELYALPAAVPGLKLGETVYRRPHPPRGLASAAAMVVLDSLPRGDAEVEIRTARADVWSAAARAARLTVPMPIPGSQPGYLRFPLLVRSDLVSRDAAAIGVTRAYPRPLADLPELAARCRNGDDPVPGARRLASTLYSVPTHSLLSSGDVRRIQDWLGAVGSNG